MTKAKVIEAIDDAFADGLKNLFAKLVSGLETEDDPIPSVERFKKGVAFHDDAHSRALAAVETIFLPE